MAFHLFVSQDNYDMYLEYGKQICPLAVLSSWCELRVNLREWAHTMCLMSEISLEDLGECTTVQLPTSVPQVLRVFLCPSRRLKVLLYPSSAALSESHHGK